MRTVRSSATALACLLAMAATSSAQSLEEKLDAKLKEPFVSNAPWVLDYEGAVQKAKAEKTVIFAYFTRSYAP
jgi:hypothetical protein